MKHPAPALVAEIIKMPYSRAAVGTELDELVFIVGITLHIMSYSTARIHLIMSMNRMMPWKILFSDLGFFGPAQYPHNYLK
jgi:hypothetical protein